ncbi:MAG: site-specific DNA-methyltransferase [Chitinophagaceae bacterium]|nr:site-specific DNA-methyltransferase [Chitinophagaceae bacterium]MCO5241256.1 site-specific DNA-methyltransferase [Chitinophagaceae bacterium]
MLSGNTIHNMDCIQGMKMMPDASVQCCVTSPPFWGLRDYGIEGQYGLEPTPEDYAAKIVEVFTEVKRLLKQNGTLWLNLGDAYWGSGKAGKNPSYQLNHTEFGKPSTHASRFGIPTTGRHPVLKPKDLIGLPWRIAFALQGFAIVPMYSFSQWADILKEAREKDDWELVFFIEGLLRKYDLLGDLKKSGWYLRQDVIWHKLNPLPESVTDRCTKAHEYIFLLAKSPKYYFDQESIRTPLKDSSVLRLLQDIELQRGSDRIPGKTNGPMKAKVSGRKLQPDIDINGGNQAKGHIPMGIEGSSFKGHKGNFKANGELIGGGMANKRSVWTVATKPFRESHFATYPEELIVDCIKAGSKENDMILDPFMGAGTTALVASLLNRKFIGFELNPEYIKIANKRLQGRLGLFYS